MDAASPGTMILRSLNILSWLIDQPVDSKQRISLIVNHHGQAGLETGVDRSAVSIQLLLYFGPLQQSRLCLIINLGL